MLNVSHITQLSRGRTSLNPGNLLPESEFLATSITHAPSIILNERKHEWMIHCLVHCCCFLAGGRKLGAIFIWHPEAGSRGTFLSGSREPGGIFVREPGAGGLLVNKRYYTFEFLGIKLISKLLLVAMINRIRTRHQVAA